MQIVSIARGKKALNAEVSMDGREWAWWLKALAYKTQLYCHEYGYQTHC